jgi:hypothetical protein
MAETGNTRFADGKLIFLSGSPELERVGRYSNRKVKWNCKSSCAEIFAIESNAFL